MSKNVIIIVGNSGAGKSTLIESIIKADGSINECPIYSTRESRDGDSTIHVERDVINEMDGFLSTAEATGELYLITTPTDGSFITAIISPHNAGLYKQYLLEKGFNVKVIHLDASISTCKQRLIDRGVDSDTVDKRLEAHNNGTIEYDLVINNDTSIDEILKTIKGDNMECETKAEEVTEEELFNLMEKVDNVIDIKELVKLLASWGLQEAQINRRLLFLTRSISPVFMGDKKYIYRDDVIKSVIKLANFKVLNDRDYENSLFAYLNMAIGVISDSINVPSIVDTIVEDDANIDVSDEQFLTALHRNVSGINMMLLSNRLTYNKLLDNKVCNISDKLKNALDKYLENGTSSIATASTMSIFITELANMKHDDELDETIRRLKGNQLIIDNGDDVDLLLGLIAMSGKDFKGTVNALLDATDEVGTTVTRDFLYATLTIIGKDIGLEFVIEAMHELRQKYDEEYGI